ncbi:hypothetical protein ACIRN4_19530 [Pimelobacter simplex]|uniref:Uncharacterized protein n=1 Tax=Nocardioides simplex TaxID=2045 RepID=A0A7J5E0G5_NOCSI|nr:hypothetical protein [Pimelobacter simplex]KAB2811761.1 hypothetical protein F9L07_07870 [Pimelobacter simplex]
MTDFVSPPPLPGPTPLAVARRRLECLACERMTAHVPGPATLGKDGEVLVRWWACAECREAHTPG